MLMSIAGKTVWFKNPHVSESHKQQQLVMQHHCEVSIYIKCIVFIGESFNVV